MKCRAPNDQIQNCYSFLLLQHIILWTYYLYKVLQSNENLNLDTSKQIKKQNELFLRIRSIIAK